MEDSISILCKNCGSPAGFDIVRQSYRCPNCGELSGIQEVLSSSPRWRRLSSRDRKMIPVSRQIFSCPCCGANILFEEGSESEVCDFCSSPLIRREFEESQDFPQMILPFVLTQQEAQAQLDRWRTRHKKDPEANWLSGKELIGYYLPYQLIRGPVHGRITRQQTFREYHCRGYLEGTLVNTSRQLNNQVLDAAEPFDLGSLLPFEHGYIAGHKVKLSDLPPGKVQRRCLQEGAAAFQKDAAKVMHTKSIRTSLHSEDLLTLPLLLPFYLIRDGNRLAVVNGQTGRVAVSSGRTRDLSWLWLIEPGFWTLFLTLLAAVYWNLYHPYFTFPMALVLGIILFSIYGKDRWRRTDRILARSRSSKAVRKDGVLCLFEGKDLIKNPFSNCPVFSEQIDGVDTVVKIRFLTPGRILELLFHMAFLTFLPLLLALPFNLNSGHFPPLSNACAWYFVSGFLNLLYFTRGIRQEIYNKPLIYVRSSSGSWKLQGKRKARSLSFLSLMGLRGIRMKERLKDPEQKRNFCLILSICTFVLVGSTIAMVL